MNFAKRLGALCLAATLCVPFLAACDFSDSSGGDGKSVYVNAETGNDSNDGKTKQTAIKSLRELSYMRLEPGTTVYLSGTFEEPLSFEGSGTKEEPITITSYGENRAVIDGLGASSSISITDQNWITIDNLEVKQTATPDELARNAIFFSATGGVMQGLSVTNCYIHDVVGTKLGQYAAGDYYNSYYASSAIGFRYLLENTDEQNKFDQVLIDNCVIENIIGCGIRFHDISKYADYRGEHPYFSNIVIEDTTIDTTAGDGIILQCCNAPIVRRCKVYRVGVLDDESTGNYHAAVWACATKSPLYEYNEIAYTKYVCGDGQAFDTDWGCSGTAIFQYNYTHDNEGGVLLRHENFAAIYRYNISVNDGAPDGHKMSGKTSILFHSNPYGQNQENFYCYNNLFYNDKVDTKLAFAYDPGYPVKAFHDAQTNIFKNNIFVYRNDVGWASKSTLDGNAYYALNGNYVPTRDAHRVAGDPLFVGPLTKTPESIAEAGSMFRLLATSPLIGKAVALTETELLNFNGTNFLGETATNNIGPI